MVNKRSTVHATRAESIVVDAINYARGRQITLETTWRPEAKRVRIVWPF